MAGEMLARQATSDTATGTPRSLTRDNQLRGQLETSLDALLGQGVVSGGVVSHTSGLSVEVAAGSVFFSRGVTLTLGAAQSYTALVANQTAYLWGKLTRTAATVTSPTASDTYALSLSHNTTGVAPDAYSFCLASIDTSATTVLSIDNAPPGKFALPRANHGYLALELAGASTTLSAAQYRHQRLHVTGEAAAAELLFPADAGGHWWVFNDRVAPLTVMVEGQTGVTLAPGEDVEVFANGTDLVSRPAGGTLAALVTDYEQLRWEVDYSRLLWRRFLRQVAATPLAPFVFIDPLLREELLLAQSANVPV